MRNSGTFSSRIGVAFMTPAGVLVTLFVVFPFFWIIAVSFTNRSLLGASALHPQLVGLKNYLDLFDPATFWSQGGFGPSLWLTVQFVVFSALCGQVLLGLVLAWISRELSPRAKSLLQGIVMLAWILPDVVVGFAWFAYLDRDAGTLNQLLRGLHVPGADFLIEHPFLTICVFNAWRGAAFSMMLFDAALQSIPPSYLETADVVGASGWQKLRDIVLPLIRGHVVTDLILITMWTFNVFTPFLLTAGGPSFETDILPIYTYRIAFKSFEFGKGAAIGVIVMLINLAFSLAYLRLAQSGLRKKGKAA
ncbi:MAG: sugar ABC transporter permease [Proteobacteria bacterium]|nr:sugar ABC transporter permease [Pseudomonadota bacterium]